MKKLTAWFLLLSLLLCGCGSAPAETEPSTVATAATESTTEPTTVPTTEPPPTYIHPLNGSILEEPYTGRIFASTISNIPTALPHVNANKADILIESFVNGSVVRCLALFSDISKVDAIGSTRSTRPVLNDLASHYDAVLLHAGGTSVARNNANEYGLDHFNVDSLMRQADPLMAGTAYRDKEYKKGEHNLFVIGSGAYSYVESLGIPVSGLPERDYGLIFEEDGTPAEGEDAAKVEISIRYNAAHKETTMEYDPETGRYVYWQYGDMMCDQFTGEPESFRNVVVMFVPMSTMTYGYHVADFVSGGTGYYACGGKILPIMWTCEDEESPFRFYTASGKPLPFGAGNTYIAISERNGTVSWTGADAAE